MPKVLDHDYQDFLAVKSLYSAHDEIDAFVNSMTRRAQVFDCDKRASAVIVKLAAQMQALANKELRKAVRDLSKAKPAKGGKRKKTTDPKARKAAPAVDATAALH